MSGSVLRASVRRRRLRLTGLLCVVVLVVGACGSDAASTTGIKPLKLAGLGAQLLDLTVETETARVKALRSVTRPYVDGVGLFSLRRDTQLEATLQVSRFTKSAKTESARFRDSVIRQIGSTTPQELRMGDDRIWLTTGRRQTVGVWFKDRYLFILSIRDEYPQPRALLRSVLEVRP